MKVVTIGRTPDNKYVVNDGMASRHHCQIVQDDMGNFTIEDLNSTNGTFVNGRSIKGRAPLYPTDVVRIANTTLRWMEYFTAQNCLPQEDEDNVYGTKHPNNNSPLVDIPSEININKREEYAEVRKRGDDFSVGFFRNMGDNIGNHLGNTVGCILSIILVVVILAIIGLIAF